MCDNRSHIHGDTTESFGVIAAFWQTYLSARNAHPVNVLAGDVAEMMSLLKKVRFIFGDKTNDENFIDDAGYTAIAGMLNGIKISNKAEPDFNGLINPPTEGAVRRAGEKAVAKAMDVQADRARTGMEVVR